MAPIAERARGLVFDGARRLVKVPPHSLDWIKRIKAAAGDKVTVNDVVYAAFSGALRSYCLQRSKNGTWGATLDRGTSARALVPIAFPRPADAPLSNDFTFVATEIPISDETPRSRLMKAHQIFSELKRSPEVLVAKAATAANSTQPTCVLRKVGQSLFSRHSLIYSNVPGPGQRIMVAGEEVQQIWPMFPNIISQLLCVSYNGLLYMTLALDAKIVLEPESLSLLYLDELRALAVEFGVDPVDSTDHQSVERPPSIANGALEKLQAELYGLPIWQSDSDAQSCRMCERVYTTLYRRHHCRKCGRLACASCSCARRVIIDKNGYLAPQRVCDACVAAELLEVSECGCL